MKQLLLFVAFSLCSASFFNLIVVDVCKFQMLKNIFLYNQGSEYVFTI